MLPLPRAFRAVVNFHQADAGAAVQSGEQSGIKARWQDCGYGSLEVVRRREPRGGDFRSLGRIVLPIVIGNEKCSIFIPKLQGWIGQRKQGYPRRSGRVRPRRMILSSPALSRERTLRSRTSPRVPQKDLVC